MYAILSLSCPDARRFSPFERPADSPAIDDQLSHGLVASSSMSRHSTDTSNFTRQEFKRVRTQKYRYVRRKGARTKFRSVARSIQTWRSKFLRRGDNYASPVSRGTGVEGWSCVKDGYLYTLAVCTVALQSRRAGEPERVEWRGQRRGRAGVAAESQGRERADSPGQLCLHWPCMSCRPWGGRFLMQTAHLQLQSSRRRIARLLASIAVERARCINRPHSAATVLQSAA